jgi:hypothetical protein
VIGVVALTVTVRVLCVLCVVLQCGRPVVEEVLRGMNCCIMAYGQTGTGMHELAAPCHSVSCCLSFETRPAADFPLSYPLHPHIRAPIVGAVSTASPISHLHHLTFGNIMQLPLPPASFQARHTRCWETYS